MDFPLKWLLFNRWLWITILGGSALVIIPFMVIYGILALSPQYRGLTTIIIVVSWGIAAGYKDWIISKRNEEKMKIKPQYLNFKGKTTSQKRK